MTQRATFTRAQRMPTAVVFNHRDGVYLIDSDSTDNDDSQLNILMWMVSIQLSLLISCEYGAYKLKGNNAREFSHFAKG